MEISSNMMKVPHIKLMVFKMNAKYVRLIHALWLERREVERSRRVFKVNKDREGNIKYYLVQDNRRHYQVYIYPSGLCIFTGRKKHWYNGKRFSITPSHLVVKGIEFAIEHIISSELDVKEYIKNEYGRDKDK